MLSINTHHNSVRGAVPREVREALCAWDHCEEYPLGPPPPPAAAAGFSRTFDLGRNSCSQLLKKSWTGSSTFTSCHD